MLTKKDRVNIGEIVNEKIKDAFTKHNKIMINEFNTIIEIVGDVSNKLDIELKTLNNYEDDLNDHERRIEKLEEKDYI